MATLFFFVNQAPYLIQSEVVAHSGLISIIRTPKTDMSGFAADIKFILATAAEIKGWMNADTTFSVGNVQVMYRSGSPISYQNMVLQDQNVDLDTSLPQAFDYWSGIIHGRVI